MKHPPGGSIIVLVFIRENIFQGWIFQKLTPVFLIDREAGKCAVRPGGLAGALILPVSGPIFPIIPFAGAVASKLLFAKRNLSEILCTTQKLPDQHVVVAVVPGRGVGRVGLRIDTAVPELPRLASRRGPEGQEHRKAKDCRRDSLSGRPAKPAFDRHVKFDTQTGQKQAQHWNPGTAGPEAPGETKCRQIHSLRHGQEHDGLTASRPSSIQTDRRHRHTKPQNQRLKAGAVQSVKRHIIRAAACKQSLTKAAHYQHAAENPNNLYHHARVLQQKRIPLIYHQQKESKSPDIIVSIRKAVSQIRQTAPSSLEHHQFSQSDHQQESNDSKHRPGRPNLMLPI